MCRGSGGLSFAIKDSVSRDFTIKPEFSPMDDLHIINLKDKTSDFTIRLYGLYIAPENSVYGQNVDQIYEYLLQKMYEHTHDDLTIVMVE